MHPVDTHALLPRTGLRDVQMDVAARLQRQNAGSPSVAPVTPRKSGSVTYASTDLDSVATRTPSNSSDQPTYCTALSALTTEIDAHLASRTPSYATSSPRSAEYNPGQVDAGVARSAADMSWGV